jgi:phage shock protein A
MGDRPDDDLRDVIRDFRASVSQQFARHDERFARLEGRMDGLEGRMGGLEGRMDGLEERMRELTAEYRDRTLTMELAILSSIRDLGRDLGHRIARTEERVDRLEQQRRDPPA